jgi:hypothetical protein
MPGQYSHFTKLGREYVFWSFGRDGLLVASPRSYRAVKVHQKPGGEAVLGGGLKATFWVRTPARRIRRCLNLVLYGPAAARDKVDKFRPKKTVIVCHTRGRFRVSKSVYKIQKNGRLHRHKSIWLSKTIYNGLWNLLVVDDNDL